MLKFCFLTNYSSYFLKFLNIKSVLFVHTVMPWTYFDLQPGNLLKKFIKKAMEISYIYFRKKL